MIKDIFSTIIDIVLLLWMLAQIIDAFCYFSFYRKYNKIFKDYKYIVGYKNKEDIIINSKFDGDVYVTYKGFGGVDNLMRIYKSDIIKAAYDFKRLLKDEVLTENEVAYELHITSFNDDNNAKEHIVYMISNVYYSTKVDDILRSFKERCN